MSFTFHILIFYFFIKSTTSNCTTGTLQCNNSDPSNPYPSICDTSNFFFLDSATKSCKKKTIPGCKIPSFSANSTECFQCDPHMVYDPEQLFCQSIPENRQIQNCHRYSMGGDSCLKCEEGYWVFGAGCRKVSGENVDHCREYKSDTECLSCEAGFFLEANQCVSFQVINNCAFHTDRVCDSCAEGYVFAPELVDLSYLYNHNFEFFETPFSSQVYWSHPSNLSNSCFKGQVKNCLDYSSPTTCKKCKSSYLLTNDFKCEHFPESPISECSEYQKADTCTKCNNGFYLIEPKTCIPATTVSNCSTYAISEDKCIHCIPNFFLSLDGTSCTKREFPVIVNCLELDLNFDKCSTCQEDYSLTSDFLKCLSNIKNCQTQIQGESINSDFHSCSLCNTNFYLESPSICASVSVENCQEYSPNSNNCIKCKESHYISNETSSSCVLRSIENCEIYQANTNTCLHCKTEFYLDSDQKICLPQLISNCIEYTLNLPTCSKCQDDFLLSNDKLNCLSTAVEHCVEFDPSVNGKCTKCSSLYVPTNNGTECSSISKMSNCLASSGESDDCSDCNPDYYLIDGSCSGELLKEMVDSHCFSNSKQTNSLSCSKCIPEYTLMQGTFLSVSFDFFESQNCLTINKETGQCIQCRDFYEFQNGGCVSVPDTESIICKRIIPNQTVSLSTNTFCELCKNPLTHFLKDGVCTLRTDTTSQQNCIQVDPSSDGSCIACKSDHFPTVPLRSRSVMAPICKDPSTVSNFTSFTDCMIYNPDFSCAFCSNGMVLSNDGSSCEYASFDYFGFVQILFDEYLNPSGNSQQGVTPIDNCDYYDQVSLNQFGCSACVYDSLKTVPQPDLQNQTPYVFGSVGEYVGFMVDYYNSFNCTDQSLGFKNELGNTHVDGSRCKIGYEINGFFGFACLACKPPYMGEIITITQDSYGSTFSEPILTVGNCSIFTAEMAKTYSLLDYPLRTSPHRLLWSNYMQFDSCTDDSKELLYMYITSIKEPFIKFSEQKENASVPLKQAYCLGQNQIPSRIEHCAIYVLSSDLSSNFDPSLDSVQNAGCVACKPGYSGWLDSSQSYYESCRAIAHCDATGTWLNACSNPTNLAWNIERIKVFGKEIEMAGYHLPTWPNLHVPSCLLHDQTSTKSICRICKPKFTLQEGGCKSIDTFDNQCESTSFGFTSMKLDSTYTNLQFSQIMYLRMNENDLVFEYSTTVFCEYCPWGQFMFLSTSIDLGGWLGLDDEKTCKVPVAGEHIPDHDINCSQVNFTDPKVCHKCRDGYLLNVSANTCHISSSFPNCALLFIDNGELKCKECESDYALNSLNLCVLHNCLEWAKDSPFECAVCSSNHIYTDESKIFCISNPSSSDKCALYSASLGHCIKCKETGMLPYIFKTNTDPIELKKMECILFPFTSPILSQYNLDYPFVLITLESDNEIRSISLESPRTIKQDNRLISAQTLSPSTFPSFHCIPTPTIPYCQTYDASTSFICTQCEPTYLLSSFNECKKGAIPGCDYYSSDGSKCASCPDSHYISDDQSSCHLRVHSTTCLNRSPVSDECLSCDDPLQWLHPILKECRPSLSKFCLEFDQNNDQCLTCLDNYWKNNQGTNISCEEYTAINCDQKNPNKDECLTCTSSFFLDKTTDPSTCKTYSAQNCLTFNKNKNECETCISNYYLKLTNNVYECIPSMIPNCLEYLPNRNFCQKCESLYYLFDFKCLPISPIEYCEEYASQTNTCLNCKLGYYFNSDLSECLPFPSGISNCIEYSSAQICSKCDVNYYLVQNKCHPVEKEVENCIMYNTSGECFKCDFGFFWDIANKKCIQTSLENCLQPASIDTCVECQDPFILISSKCIPSSVRNCEKPDTKNENLCLECSKFYTLSEDKSFCKKVQILIENCQNYNSLENCIECERNYILSKDGKKCEKLNGEAGEFCDRGKFIGESICDVCQLGYYRDDRGVCQLSKISKCWVYDSISDSCLLCESGTFMDSEGKCIFDFSANASLISIGIYFFYFLTFGFSNSF